jgi:hypothetical protein
MVRCTWFTWCGTHNLPRNDTVLPSMGTSPDAHCKSSGGYIAAWLKCLFGVEDAESGVNGCLALVDTFETGPR